MPAVPGRPVRALQASSPWLLLASAGALVRADVERWVDDCGRSAPPCEVREDHLYDYLPPLAPWEPAGDAATWAALSLGLLTLAVLGAALVVGRTRAHVVEAVLAVVLSAVTATLSAATAWAAVQGRAVDGDEGWGRVVVAAVVTWVFVSPVLWVALGLTRYVGEPGYASPPGSGPALAAGVLLACTSPIGSYLIATAVTGGSYDTPAWDGVVIAVLLLAAALALLRVRALERRVVRDQARPAAQNEASEPSARA